MQDNCNFLETNNSIKKEKIMLVLLTGNEHLPKQQLDNNTSSQSLSYLA